MKKRNLVLVIPAILLVFGLVMSCGPAEEPTPGLFDVTQNGVKGTTTTTTLTIKINQVGDDPITASDTFAIFIENTLVTHGGSFPTFTVNYTATDDKSIKVKVTITGNGKNLSDEQSVNVYLSDADKSDLVAAEAQKYFNNDFRATYTLTSGKAIEQFLFTKTTLTISELFKNGGSVPSDEFISATIDKWESVPVGSIPTWGGAYDQYPSNEFKIGFKVTGYITNAKPKDASTLYGSKTAPGYKESDIAAKTPAVMYFYIYDEAPDIVIVRSVFTKDGSSKDPVTGSDADAAVRVYEKK